jgi:choline dehydrogenase-like flavoprotein
VLERGRYVEPRHFTEDEVGMIVQLYADGLMQQTEDWRFTVLQGSCVGGSTTVNNAVCFDPPAAVLARWNAAYDAGLDVPELRRSVKAVRSLLRVAPQTDAVLNPSGLRYLKGAEKLPDGKLDTGVVNANIEDCFGSGYCNIGCKWGKKLSMLETVLPAAQRAFGDRVRIVADCEAERIVTRSGSSKRVACVRAKLADGRGLTVRARTYVVCAGSVASSYLLLRSGAGRGLPVGKGFSCNMGAPLTADFDGEPLRSYDGLQISHFGIPSKDGFVFETWFNPPVSQALNMPGWFEQHFANMQRYDHLMAVGVLVGTASNGRIVRALTGGPGVDFRPQPGDLATLARGLRVLGELLFEAGASRVMVNSWDYDEFTSPRDLGRIDRIAADPDYISLGTGHPQGGNAISRDPRRGVVRPDFRVHGYEDLYICDASVFPTSLTVNPQLTIMALAHYAAQRIADP